MQEDSEAKEEEAAKEVPESREDLGLEILAHERYKAGSNPRQGKTQVTAW